MEQAFKYPAVLNFTSKMKKTNLEFKNNSQSFVIYKIRSNDKKALQIKLPQGYIEPMNEKFVSAQLITPPTAFKKLKLQLSWGFVSQQFKNQQKKIGDLSSAQLKKIQIEINYSEVQQKLQQNIIDSSSAININSNINIEEKPNVSNESSNIFVSNYSNQKQAILLQPIVDAKKQEYSSDFNINEVQIKQEDGEIQMQLLHTRSQKQNLARRLQNLKTQLKQCKDRGSNERYRINNKNVMIVFGLVIASNMMGYLLRYCFILE